MPVKPMSSPSSSTTWRPKEDPISIAETYSQRLSSVSAYSNLSGDNFVTLPTTTQGGANFPPPDVGGYTPEISRKIESASPEAARLMAMRMYQSLKRNGRLRDEVGKAMRRDVEIMEMEGGDGNNRELPGEVERKSEELMGMEYLLRDGFVSYLRDVARITPPIPQQVIGFY